MKGAAGSAAAADVLYQEDSGPAERASGSRRHVLARKVEQFSERRRDVVRFTLEWGFFSVRFAQSIGRPPDPNLLHSPLRGRIGMLVGDGQFDVWWPVRKDGTVTRDSGGRSEPVTVETYTELEDAIVRRLSAAVAAVTDTEALIQHAEEFVGQNLCWSYSVDLERVLEILRSPVPADAAVPAPGALPPVEVEWEPSRRRWLVTFADDVAHSRPDLIEECVEYCRRLPAVERVDWHDRELLVLRAGSLDASQLQGELLALVESGIRDDEGLEGE